MAATPNAWVLYRLARLYTQLGRPELAIDRLTRGLSTFPRDSTGTVSPPRFQRSAP